MVGVGDESAGIPRLIAREPQRLVVGRRRAQVWPFHDRQPIEPAISGADTDSGLQLSVGGTVTLPLEKQAWGDEAGSLVDQFGINWMFNITGHRH
ncbi:hypothetical protein [Nocardia sp. NPDC050175]|uniref:hypothetical protein n=1 Tax=Nocardia sp. NPDC050175 TaxID=3364317 RepID=UPI0037A00213